MAPAIGIDFGNSYSCVSVLRNKAVEIIPNEHEKRRTPSFVAFRDLQRLIGDPAKDQIHSNPYNTVYNLKLLLGQLLSSKNLPMDVKAHPYPFKIIEKGFKPHVVVEWQEEKTFAIEEMVAMILIKMRSIAESYLGSVVDGAVISVPAFFNSYQRGCIRDAALIAGLNVLRIVNESSAAAMAYVSENPSPTERTVLIFGLGGDALNVSLVDLIEDFVQVRSTVTAFGVGGEFFNRRLFNHFAEEFKSKYQKNLTSNARAVARLFTACEHAKCILSSSFKATVELDSLYDGHDFYSSITRSRFEELCQDLFRSIFESVEGVITDGNFDKRSISEIVLTGGSTRIPKIQSLLSIFFYGKELKKSMNPDEMVASGLARQAGLWNGEVPAEKRLLWEVQTITIGIATRGTNTIDPWTGGTIVDPLIKRNTLIPVSCTRIFSTSDDFQTAMVLRFFEGERDHPEDNQLIGDFKIAEIPPAPQGVAKVKVTVNIDAAGVIRVTVRADWTGKRLLKKEVLGYNSLTREQLERMLADAEKYKDMDEEEAARVAAKNSLESYVYSLKGSMEGYRAHDLDNEIHECLTWLQQNQFATEEEYDDKRSTLEVFAATVTSKPSANPPESASLRGATALHPPGKGRRPRYTNSLAYGPVVQHSGIPAAGTAQSHASSSTTASLPRVKVSHHRRTSGFVELRNAQTTENESSNDDNNPSTHLPVQKILSLLPPPPEAQGSGDSSPSLSTAHPHSIEQRLGELFDPVSGARRGYTDSEFEQISRLLDNIGRPQWSKVPRIYTVLRIIDGLPLIDKFIDEGITDIWFPFTEMSLPGALSPSARANFIRSQSLVLTKALQFENSPEKKHAHFDGSELVPFLVLGRLGAGSQSDVEKVVSLISHREYARKSFRRRKSFTYQKEDIRSFKTELQTLKRVSHRHCVELVGSYTDPKFFALIMSPVADCNLATFYNLAAGSPDSLSLLRGWFGCMANALQYLHASKIRHRDIKPQNILVKGDIVYLADFGIALDWGDLTRSTTTEDAGKTWVYAAPEIAQCKSRNSSSDIWSLGCVFLEMAIVLKGETVSEMRDSFRNRNGDYRFYNNLDTAREWMVKISAPSPVEETTPVKWVDSMLQEKAQLRPTAFALFDEITNVEGPFSFCSPCCREGNDSDAPDDDTNDPWAEDTVT